jgi:molybdopterin synthase catalytic subunit
VLFFGMLKDVAGRAEECVDLAPGGRLGALFDLYAARFPRFGELASSIVMARNHEFAAPDAELSDGDEVAFLPPVSGGAGEVGEVDRDGHYFALTGCVIDVGALRARLLTGAEGAVVTFEGVVRNNTKGRRTLYLDYECYPPMALKKMTEIGLDVARSYEVTRVAMVHRLGRMLIGETSVAVVATAPHRRAAFEAAHEGLNRLKRLVPIWKKERFADGEVWVEGEWDESAPKASG